MKKRGFASAAFILIVLVAVIALASVVYFTSDNILFNPVPTEETCDQPDGTLITDQGCRYLAGESCSATDNGIWIRTFCENGIVQEYSETCTRQPNDQVCGESPCTAGCEKQIHRCTEVEEELRCIPRETVPCGAGESCRDSTCQNCHGTRYECDANQGCQATSFSCNEGLPCSGGTCEAGQCRESNVEITREATRKKNIRKILERF